MTKQIGRRNSGMKFQTFNFHAGLHIADDILEFRVPRCVDTSAQEMNHKPDKKCAKRTQRQPKTFDYQCALRMHEMDLLDLAAHDLDGRPVYHYLAGYDKSIPSEDESKLPKLGDIAVMGTKADFWTVENGDGNYSWCLTVHSRMKRYDRFVFKNTVNQILSQIYDVLKTQLTRLPIATEVHVIVKNDDLFCGESVKKQIYRASPFYRGKPWYDWAWAEIYDTDNDIEEEEKDEESTPAASEDSESETEDDDYSDTVSVVVQGHLKVTRKSTRVSVFDRQPSLHDRRNNDDDTDDSYVDEENGSNASVRSDYEVVIVATPPKKEVVVPETPPTKYPVLAGLASVVKPVQICCFIDLEDLPVRTNGFSRGVYALVQVAEEAKNDPQRDWSSLLVLYFKQTSYKIIPVSRLIGPVCMVPDLSNRNTHAYFALRSKNDWAELFEDWLLAEHTRDFDEPQERNLNLKNSTAAEKKETSKKKKKVTRKKKTSLKKPGLKKTAEQKKTRFMSGSKRVAEEANMSTKKATRTKKHRLNNIQEA